MKISKILLATITSLILLAGCASRDTLVSTVPQAGLEKRPLFIADAIGPATQPASKAAPLPAGHPDISSMKRSAPGALPAGHPDLGAMKQPAPTTQPQTLGTLMIRVQQGTKGAAPVELLPATIELILPDETVLDKFESRLGKDGTLQVDDMPLSKAFSPRVRLNYAGVDYTAVGTPFDAEHLTQNLTVTVYESTPVEPAWSVKMQHVMVEPLSADKLQVEEMVSVQNPGDKSWLGKETGEPGKRASLNLPLPQGASDVQLGEGFGKNGAIVQPDRVSVTSALLPGETQFRLAYTLPVNAGKARLDLTTPGQVQNMIVFLPNDATQVTPENIIAMGVADMGKGSMKFFRANDLPAGTPVRLSLNNVPSAPAQAAAMPTEAPVASETSAASIPSTGSSAGMIHIAQAVAGTGALLILLFGAAFLLTKGPKGKRKAA